MRRHELTDEQWRMVEPLLRSRRRGAGRPPADARTVLDGVLWILGTGAPWRDLPARFGSWQTVHRRFSRWRDDGTFLKVVQALQVRLDERGLIDWELWSVDGASVRASRSAAGASKKASRGSPRSPKTTRLAAREAGLDRSSTWLLTARALPSQPRSPRGKSTSRRARSR